MPKQHKYYIFCEIRNISESIINTNKQVEVSEKPLNTLFYAKRELHRIAHETLLIYNYFKEIYTKCIIILTIEDYCGNIYDTRKIRLEKEEGI